MLEFWYKSDVFFGVSSRERIRIILFCLMRWLSRNISRRCRRFSVKSVYLCSLETLTASVKVRGSLPWRAWFWLIRERGDLARTSSRSWVSMEFYQFILRNHKASRGVEHDVGCVVHWVPRKTRGNTLSVGEIMELYCIRHRGRFERKLWNDRGIRGARHALFELHWVVLHNLIFLSPGFTESII